MDFVIFWASCIVLSGVIAAFKRRSSIFWAFLTIFLGPIAVLWILLKSKVPKPRPLVVPTTEDVAEIKLGVGDIVEGIRAQIEIRDGGIAIRRDTGSRNMILQGAKGEKRIAYRSLSAVQLRMPTDLMSGYIQFSLVGGIEGGRGIFEAAKDENSVLFVDTESARMMALRDYIERALNGTDAVIPTTSVVDQLTKLADLKDRGAITAEEFAARKAILLG